jgi:general secretion pathway protein G
MIAANGNSSQVSSMTRVTGARQRGFTLIEIMVVVVIIGLLTAVVTTQVFSRVEEARITKARQDISALTLALQMYRLDNSRYPTTEQGLAALMVQPTSEPIPNSWRPGGYLSRPSKDPWKADYIYVSPGQNGEFDLYSLGADGEEGGEGPNADITSWDVDQ